MSPHWFAKRFRIVFATSKSCFWDDHQVGDFGFLEFLRLALESARDRAVPNSRVHQETLGSRLLEIVQVARILRGPLQYQVEKRLGFAVSPLSRWSRMALQAVFAEPKRRPTTLSRANDGILVHRQRPRFAGRSWMLRRLPLFGWNTETLHRLWWERCGVPHFPSLILSSWSKANLQKTVARAKLRGFRRILIEMNDATQFVALEGLNVKNCDLQIEVLLPPELLDVARELGLDRPNERVGFSCDSLLAAKLEKQKKSKKNSRTFSCLNVLPPLGCLHLKIDAHCDGSAESFDGLGSQRFESLMCSIARNLTIRRLSQPSKMCSGHGRDRPKW